MTTELDRTLDPRPPDPLARFAWLWAAMTVIEMGKWGTWLGDRAGLLIFASALIVLLVPDVTACFLGLLVLQGWVWLGKLPWLTNHSLVAALVDLTLLAAAVLAGVEALRRRVGNPPQAPGFRECWYATFAPFGRAELIVVYTLATLHKLNTGWFDSSASCARLFWGRLAAWTPWPGLVDELHPVAPFVALGVEAVLPLALAVPRTRAIEVLVGLGFHLLLGLVGFFRFSALVTVLYSLFLPDDLAAEMTHRARRVAGLLAPGFTSDRWHSFRRLAAVAVGIAALAAVGWRSGSHLDDVPLLIKDELTGPTGVLPRLFQAAWFCGTLALICLLLAVLLKRHRSGTAFFAGAVEPTPTSAPGARLLWIFPILASLNGLSPYLGLRTDATFSMFSNLRVYGDRSNHLLIRRPLQWIDDGARLAAILDSSDPHLRLARDRNYRIPWIELCRYVRSRVARGDDLSLNFELDGVVRNLPSVLDEIDWFPEPISWRSWLAFYRSVNLDEACRCSH